MGLEQMDKVDIYSPPFIYCEKCKTLTQCIYNWQSHLHQFPEDCNTSFVCTNCEYYTDFTDLLIGKDPIIKVKFPFLYC
jgi:hypothetical protein